MDNKEKSPNNLIGTGLLVFKQTFIGFYWGLVIFTPLFITYILVKYLPGFFDFTNPHDQIRIILLIVVYGVVVAVFSIVVTHLQFIQRLLILYTRGILSPKRVKSVSKLIFKDTFLFRLYLIAKYYLLVIILSLTACGFSYLTIHQFLFGEQYNVSVVLYKLGVVAAAVLIIWFYNRYYLSAKLRYAWFSFLNNFDNFNVYEKTIQEMNVLNSIKNGNSMLRSMTTQMKNDTIADAAGTGMSLSIHSIKSSANLMGPIKDIAGGYVKQFAYDLANYHTLINNHDLYSDAYKKFFNKDYVINSKFLSENENK